MKKKTFPPHILFLFLLFFLFVFCGCRDSKQKRVNTVSDLNNSQFKIGGMTGIAATRTARRLFPKAELLEYSMPIDAFIALCSEKIDAVVLDRPTLEYMSVAHPELLVMEENIGTGHISVAASKQNTALIGQVNEFIRRYRADGTYRQMYDRWFHKKNSTMPKIAAPLIVRNKLKIGITANDEPMCFIQNGEMAGFDTEFALRLGAYMHCKVEFIDLPYDALPAALESGKIDLAIAQMDAMPERMESLLFSENYIDSPITILIHKEQYRPMMGKISSFEDLNSPDRRIACESEIAATKEAKKRIPKARYLEFPSPTDCCTALAKGKVDAMVYDRPILEHVALSHPELIVFPDNLAVGHISVAAAKHNKELIGKTNEFIRKYRADGTFKDMYNRWVLTSNSVMPDIPAPSNPDGVLRIGVTSYNPPMCGVSNNTLVGFDIEFSYRLGLFLNKKVEFVDLPYEGLIPAMAGGKIDLAVAQMDATPEREDSVLFSEEYIDSPITLLVRKSSYAAPPQKTNHDSAENSIRTLKDLAGKKIGTLTGCVYDQLAKEYLPPYTLMSFSQLNHAVVALESGKIDGFFTDEPIGRYLLLQRTKLMAIPEKIPCGSYAFIFSRKNKKLRDAFSDEIRKMKQDGTLKKLQDKWFSLNEEKQVLPKQKAYPKKISFATVPEVAPFVFVRNDEIVGYDVEVAILCANRLGYQLECVPVDFVAIVEMVNSGKCDCAGSCLIITKEREENVLFSEPDYDGGISVIVRKPDCDETIAENVETWLEETSISLIESFQKTFIREKRWKLILQGLFTTLTITFFSVVLGTILAFPICMMCRSKRILISWLGDRYVSLIMGTPILVILMILYYVVFAKVDINGVIVAILAFGMDFAAYTSVTLRSGIDGIPVGQTEAALALGYRPTAAFFRFVLPQAVRTVLPVYRGEIISTLKSTSIVGYIAIMDLTKMGDIIRSRTYEAFFPLIAIAVIYFFAAKCLTGMLIFVENKVNPDSRRKRLQKRGAK